MQALLDYSVAVVVGGVVLLILLSLEWGGQRTSIEASQFEAAKKGVFSFVDMMQQDFRNVGSQFPNYTLDPDDVITRFDTTATPHVFEFRGQTEPGQPPKLITYEWEESGETVSLSDGPTPLIDVRRKVDGTLTGQSTGMITHFEIHLKRDDPSLPIFNLKDTRQIVVRLKAISPLEAGEFLEELSFNSVYRPVGMTRKDFTSP